MLKKSRLYNFANKIRLFCLSCFIVVLISLLIFLPGFINDVIGYHNKCLDEDNYSEKEVQIWFIDGEISFVDIRGITGPNFLPYELTEENEEIVRSRLIHGELQEKDSVIIILSPKKSYYHSVVGIKTDDRIFLDFSEGRENLVAMNASSVDHFYNRVLLMSIVEGSMLLIFFLLQLFRVSYKRKHLVDEQDLTNGKSVRLRKYWYRFIFLIVTFYSTMILIPLALYGLGFNEFHTRSNGNRYVTVECLIVNNDGFKDLQIINEDYIGGFNLSEQNALIAYSRGMTTELNFW